MFLGQLSQTLLHPPVAEGQPRCGGGGQPGGLAWVAMPSTHTSLTFLPENGNRYEGYWQRGLKNGSGRFFHLDHGQLFEGFWVDDVAKCGTMIDFGRNEAPEPTQFPIPKVGSSH